MTVATGATGPTNVVQTTGTSTTAVMSQKAVTDLFYTKAEIDKMYSYNKYVYSGDMNNYTTEVVVGLVDPSVAHLPLAGTNFWVRVIGSPNYSGFCIQEAISFATPPRVFYRRVSGPNKIFDPWFEK